MNFKKTLFLITLLALSLSVFGQVQNTGDFYKSLLSFDESEYLPAPEAGEYVIYENNFADNKMLLTILHLGDKRFILQTFNRITYAVNNFMVRIKEEDQRYAIEELSVKSGDFASMDFQLAQTDFLKILDNRSDLDVSGFPQDIIKTDRWNEINSRFTSTYKYWVPITNLYSRIDKNNEKNSIKLLRFGKVNSIDNTDLFEFRGLKTDFDNSPTSIIASKADRDVSFDGITLHLDANWSELDDSKTAIFNIENQRYASININSVSKNNLPDMGEQFFYTYLSRSGAFILPGSVEISDYKGTPLLRCKAINPRNLQQSSLIIMYFDRGDFVSILTFSSFSNFYLNNQNYFDNILF